MTTHDAERRDGERRGRNRMHWPEQRSGFDRRGSSVILGTLRDNAWTLLFVLVLLNVLSAADWYFTLRALEHGATEANPVLNGLLARDPHLAAVFKFGMILTISAVIWMGRRYRLVLATGLVAVFTYSLVIVYHLGGLAVVGLL
jgi:hypothetical protein